MNDLNPNFDPDAYGTGGWRGQYPEKLETGLAGLQQQVDVINGRLAVTPDGLIRVGF